MDEIDICVRPKKTNKTFKKKAIKSRWFSFDKAVLSMTDEFQAVAHTLCELDETELCPTAHGYLVLLTKLRFLSTLYVLGDVLPTLACFHQIKP